jgi:hypothetical protein
MLLLLVKLWRRLVLMSFASLIEIVEISPGGGLHKQQSTCSRGGARCKGGNGWGLCRYLWGLRARGRGVITLHLVVAVVVTDYLPQQVHLRGDTLLVWLCGYDSNLTIIKPLCLPQIDDSQLYNNETTRRHVTINIPWELWRAMSWRCDNWTTTIRKTTTRRCGRKNKQQELGGRKTIDNWTTARQSDVTRRYHESYNGQQELRGDRW